MAFSESPAVKAERADRVAAGATQKMPLARRAFMLASMSFLSSFTLLEGSPRTSAVSSEVANRESILTAIEL